MSHGSACMQELERTSWAHAHPHRHQKTAQEPFHSAAIPRVILQQNSSITNISRGTTQTMRCHDPRTLETYLGCRLLAVPLWHCLPHETVALQSAAYSTLDGRCPRSQCVTSTSKNRTTVPGMPSLKDCCSPGARPTRCMQSNNYAQVTSMSCHHTYVYRGGRTPTHIDCREQMHLAMLDTK